MKWFRLYAEMLHDPTIQLLDEALRWRFVALLCLKCNVSETLHDSHIIYSLRINKRQWAITKKAFIDAGLIDELNNIINWEKRQYISDNSTERVKKHRELKRFNSVTVTPPDTDPDTDQIQNTEDSTSNEVLVIGKPTTTDCPQAEIIQLYHEILPECPRVKKWEGKRMVWLRARWREDPEHQRLEFWRAYFEFVRQSDFLMGRTEPAPGRRIFIASLEWLIKSDNFIKVQEGRYS